jgi:hypothetical protein
MLSDVTDLFWASLCFFVATTNDDHDDDDDAPPFPSNCRLGFIVTHGDIYQCLFSKPNGDATYPAAASARSASSLSSIFL